MPVELVAGIAAACALVILVVLAVVWRQRGKHRPSTREADSASTSGVVTIANPAFAGSAAHGLFANSRNAWLSTAWEETVPSHTNPTASTPQAATGAFALDCAPDDKATSATAAGNLYAVPGAPNGNANLYASPGPPCGSMGVPGPELGGMDLYATPRGPDPVGMDLYSAPRAPHSVGMDLYSAPRGPDGKDNKARRLPPATQLFMMFLRCR